MGRSRYLQANSEGRVSEKEAGAHLAVRMELVPQGPLVLLLPFLRRLMRRREQRNLAAIKAALKGEDPTVWTPGQPPLVKTERRPTGSEREA